jgi:hypothetical protein
MFRVVREADNLPPYSADVKKSRSLNSPRPLWACMACNGCALPLLLHVSSITCSTSGGATQTALGILRAEISRHLKVLMYIVHKCTKCRL